jgi:tetratricopeptide (TPR) repeat protein
LRDAKVIEQSREFVPVWLDGDALMHLVKNYEVKEYPCVLFFTPEGGLLIEYRNDYRNSTQRLIATMDEAIKLRDKDRQKLASLKSAVELRPNDARANYELGKYYAEKHIYAQSDKYLAKALEADPNDKAGVRTAAYWYLLRSTTKRAVDDAAMWEKVEGYIADANATIPRKDAKELTLYYELLVAVHGRNDVSAAGQIAAQLKALFPSGKLANKGADIATRVKHYGTDNEPLDP